jgi:hypothetical protein
MKKIIAILTLASALAASANTVTTVNDCTLTFDTGLLSDLLPTIESQQYWNSSTYAESLAAQFGASCGMPNSYQSPNDEGPLFLYAYNEIPDDGSIQFYGWVWFDDAACPITINSSYTESVAILSDVPDAPATLPLAAVGLAALVAFRRKQKLHGISDVH